MRRCQEVPPMELLKAIDEFNRGEWFECHETLEELWVGEKGELRDFYQGLLQIAVALHHWRNGNYKGAVGLLERGSDCLSRVSPVCQGVDVAHLVAEAGEVREALVALGEERMPVLAPHLIPKLRMIKPLCAGENS